jgi:hypothetical protein
MEDSVGETPTDATGTVALPEKSRTIGAYPPWQGAALYHLSFIIYPSSFFHRRAGAKAAMSA